jgi:hypothetical protein
VLIRQLQDQHYHQYMQQLLQKPPTMQNNRPLDSSNEDGQNEKSQLLANGANPEAEESEDSQGKRHIFYNLMFSNEIIKAPA